MDEQLNVPSRSWRPIEVSVCAKKKGAVPNVLVAATQLAAMLNRAGIGPGEVLFPPMGQHLEIERGFRFPILVYCAEKKPTRAFLLEI